MSIRISPWDPLPGGPLEHALMRWLVSLFVALEVASLLASGRHAPSGDHR